LQSHKYWGTSNEGGPLFFCVCQRAVRRILLNGTLSMMALAAPTPHLPIQRD